VKHFFTRQAAVRTGRLNGFDSFALLNVRTFIYRPVEHPKTHEPDMLLKGENIHFSYPGETLLRGFHFEIEKGEHVVFRGESGSGKSTLFRLILGFEQSDKGRILWEGEPLSGTHLKNFRKQTAWLPQDLNLGEGTVEKVMSFPFTFSSRKNGIPGRDRTLQVLGDLGLEPDVYEKEYRDLSTGQRQRAGIALCILLDRPVMLLDEPTSALDEASKQRALDHLRNASGRTLLSTSHDPWWVERCDRIIDLNAEPVEQTT
jgi:putative ABC transport system ATP-binding protein